MTYTHSVYECIHLANLAAKLVKKASGHPSYYRHTKYFSVRKLVEFATFNEKKAAGNAIFALRLAAAR